MFYCYLIRCSDNSLYCGQTKSLKRRVREHNHSFDRGAKYLRAKKPVTLVYFEEFMTLKEAMRREIEIKKLTKTQKEHMIKNWTNDSKNFLLEI